MRETSQSVLEISLERAFPESRIPAVNVASVPQRSPLRYPGGKTWLIPHVRRWLESLESRPSLIVEPFAGGGTVTLTAIMEDFVDRALLADLDSDISSFWRAALDNPEELIALVDGFKPTRDQIQTLESKTLETPLMHGFRTLVLNRTRRGGVLAPGAALTRNGENGNGVASRWYPETLQRRLQAIGEVAHRIEFVHDDALRILEEMAPIQDGVCYFIDPPYTARGGKKAGSRLYAHNTVDHPRLFGILADSEADFLMTYDYSDEVVALVNRHSFHAAVVLMKNGHHAKLPELVITREPIFV